MSNAAKFRKRAAEFELQKQFDKAIASYVRAIEAGDAEGEEVDVTLLNKVGDLALRLGRVPEAVDSYERAVDHYAAVGLFNNAVALCNKILRHAPGRVGVYLMLGRVCCMKGMRGDATRNFLEYASRMQNEGRTEDAMRALAEVSTAWPELEEVRQLVEEHAARAGIALPSAVEAAAATRQSQGSPSNLVFLDIDYDAAIDLTPPLGTVPIEYAPPAVPVAPAGKGRAPAKPTPRTNSLDDLLIFDPTDYDEDAGELLEGLESTYPEEESAEVDVSQSLLISADLDVHAENVEVAAGLVDALGNAPDDSGVKDAELETEVLDGLFVDEGVVELNGGVEVDGGVVELNAGVEGDAGVAELNASVEADAVADEEEPSEADASDDVAFGASDSAQVELDEEGTSRADEDGWVEQEDIGDPAHDTQIEQEAAAEIGDVTDVTEGTDTPEHSQELTSADAAEATHAGQPDAIVPDDLDVAADLADDQNDLLFDPLTDLSEEAAQAFQQAQAVESDDAETSEEASDDIAEAVDWIGVESSDLESYISSSSSFDAFADQAVEPFEFASDEAESGPFDNTSDEREPEIVADESDARDAHFAESTGDEREREIVADESDARDARFAESTGDDADIRSADDSDDAGDAGDADDVNDAADAYARDLNDAAGADEALFDLDAIEALGLDNANEIEAAADKLGDQQIPAIEGLEFELDPESDTDAEDESLLPELLAIVGSEPVQNLEFLDIEKLEDVLAEQFEPAEPPASRARDAVRRLNPHDFILPGELPPIIYPDSLLRAALDALSVVSARESDGAAVDSSSNNEIELLDLGADAVAHNDDIELIDLGVDTSSAANDIELIDLGLDTSSTSDDIELIDLDADTSSANNDIEFIDLDSDTASAANDIELIDLGVDTSSANNDIEFIDLDTDTTPAADDIELLDLNDIDSVDSDDADDPETILTPRTPAAAMNLALDRCAQLREEVDNHPGDWTRRRRLAEALLEAGEIESGLAELSATVLGLEVEGNLTEAARVADELVQVAPDVMVHHQKRVELAVRMGDRDRLRESYLDFADAMVRTGQAQRAEPVYVRVLELDPWDDRARAALGDAAPPPPAPRPAPAAPAVDDGYVNLADWLSDDSAARDTRMRVKEPTVTGDEDADFGRLLQHFRDGVSRSLGEDDYESHYDLGVAYKEMGLLDDAIAEFQRALRSPKHRLAAYEALGQCFLEQGSYPVAVTVLSRALHEPGLDDEQRVGVLYLLGYSCEALQRRDEARGYFQRVYATDIHFRDVAERLAALERGAR